MQPEDPIKTTGSDPESRTTHHEAEPAGPFPFCHTRIRRSRFGATVTFAPGFRQVPSPRGLLEESTGFFEITATRVSVCVARCEIRDLEQLAIFQMAFQAAYLLYLKLQARAAAAPPPPLKLTLAQLQRIMQC